jgi:hypothetical protein
MANRRAKKSGKNFEVLVRAPRGVMEARKWDQQVTVMCFAARPVTNPIEHVVTYARMTSLHFPLIVPALHCVLWLAFTYVILA